MTLRTLIVDDEVLARDLVRSLLASESDVEIVGECDSGKQAVSAIAQHKPDLVFLDVQMPGLSGIDVLGKLDATAMPYIVFVTAHDRYAIQAFEVQALDYLLKPLRKDRFAAAVKRARETLQRDDRLQVGERLQGLVRRFEAGTSAEAEALHFRAGHLEIREGRKLSAIPWEDIAWIQSANQYVKVNTRDRQHLLSRSLASLEQVLPAASFVRIHRSAIVNVDYVEEIAAVGNGTYAVILRDGSRLTLSRSRRVALMKLLQRN